MNIYIKYMVCERCILQVKRILSDIGAEYESVQLGVACFKNNISEEQNKKFKMHLLSCGLDIVEDNKSILIEKIKTSIINMIDDDEELSNIKLSAYLSHKLHYNYTYMANVFSQETGINLSDYIIALRIERVKAMMLYDSYTISEIAWKLNYSSVAHLSNQFTKITGVRPSQYKKSKQRLLAPLANSVVGVM